MVTPRLPARVVQEGQAEEEEEVEEEEEKGQRQARALRAHHAAVLVIVRAFKNRKYRKAP